jgi:uncharacterized phage protein (TIGR01671 family)
MTKYRIWDKISKKMYYDGNTENGDTVVITIDGHLKFLDNDGTYQESDFVVMQSIFKRDKNGKDIYEYDIVKFERNDSLSKFNTGIILYWADMQRFAVKTIRKIKNEELFPSAIPVDDDRSLIFEKMCYCENMEVIGNEFENPEMEVKE